MNRIARTTATIATAAGIAGIAAAGLSGIASAATVPTVGVGTALTTIAAEGTKYHGEPDASIGRLDCGTVADPIAPGTARAYTFVVKNAGTATETLSISSTSALVSGFPTSITLLPGQTSAQLPVTLTVPANAKAGTVTGDLWAATAPPANAKPGTVNDVVRSGIAENITVS